MRSRKIQAVFVWGALAVLFIFGGMALGVTPFKNAALAVLSPFTGAMVKTVGWFSGVEGTIAQIKNGYADNERLKEENRNLTGMLGDYEDLKKENDLLRKQLQVSSSAKLNLLLANVVSFDPLLGFSAALIDKGVRDGVALGMPVVRPGNALVGKISEVYAGFSRVTLISDPDIKVSVKSAGSDTGGVLSGAVGNMLLFDLIEKGAPLNQGDLVVTSGLDGTYPKNLVVGWVKEVVSSEVGIFKQAYLTPVYAGFAETQVFVIRDYLK